VQARRREVALRLASPIPVPVQAPRETAVFRPVFRPTFAWWFPLVHRLRRIARSLLICRGL